MPSHRDSDEGVVACVSQPQSQYALVKIVQRRETAGRIEPTVTRRTTAWKAFTGTAPAFCSMEVRADSDLPPVEVDKASRSHTLPALNTSTRAEEGRKSL